MLLPSSWRNLAWFEAACARRGQRERGMSSQGDAAPQPVQESLVAAILAPKMVVVELQKNDHFGAEMIGFS
jgi:hypothetical protein